MTDAPRRDRRFPSQQDLLVRCDSWTEFAQLYAADVSQGGMFVLTDKAPPILSEVEVAVQLPEGHHLQLKGTVVHVLGPEQAALQGRQAGVGIAFSELGPEHKNQIIQLVEFARWEGGAPGASFARRMFETAASLPPSKVLDALPPAVPGAASPVVPPNPLLPRSGAPAPEDGAPRSRATGSEEANAARNTANRSLVPGGAEPRVSRQPSARATGEHGRPPAAAPPEVSRPPSARTTGEHARPPTASPPEGSRPPSARTTGEHARPPTGAPPGASAAPTPPAPGKPVDAGKLKLGITHLAHKRVDQAVKTFEELLAETPGDRQLVQYLHLSKARLRVKNKDDDGAAEHYQKLLEVDEGNHEARRFVREHHQRKRLSALPFGRYFVKKP